MKWVLFCAAAFTLPLQAMSKKHEFSPSEREFAIQEHEKEPQPPPFDADLFRKDDQIYSIHAEFLYWTIAEGALDYALKMRHAAWSTTSPSFAQGRFESASYDFDPGFRIGLLYFRALHYWEIKWQYTRVTLDGHDFCSKPSADQKFLTGTFPQIMTAPLAEASSHIHFNYNVFDWIVDRVFIPNPHLRLRIIGAATCAWMNQDWKVHYLDSAPHLTTIRNKWDFIGAGLRSGSMIDWYWTGNLYMTGLGTIGALVGSYSNHTKQTTSFQFLPTDNTAVPVRDTSFKNIRPTFTAQMLLGPSWQKNYCKNRVEIFAGFEMNLWFNLQEIYRSTGGSPSTAKETWFNTSLLALYGVTTRLTVDF